MAWALLLVATALLLREQPGRGLYALAWLSAAAFPGLWVACAPRGGLRQRAHELAVGALVALPLLALLAPWSTATPEDARACALGVGASWIAVGLWVLVARGTPAARLAWALGLGLGVPLAQRLVCDTLGGERRGWTSAADALRLGWGGAPSVLDMTLACAPWLLLAGGAAALRWVRRPALAAGLALVSAGLALAGPGDARLVLGGWTRPGEPTPLWLEADPALPGAPGVKIAGARALIPDQGGVFPVAGPPAPSELVRLEVGREVDGVWTGETDPEALEALPAGALLVGTLGGALPPGLAPPSAVVVPLEPRDVGLLARAGQALDVVWIAPGDARPAWVAPLAAWAACGGTLVLTDAADAARWELRVPGARATGSGWVVFAPAARPRLGEHAARAFQARPATRARRRATLEALGNRAPPPAPESVERWLVGVALGWLALVLVVARWGRAAPPLLAAASLAATALVGVGSPAGPRVLSAQVLEACSGSDVASRLELLTLFAPRPQELELALPGPGSPPWPVHERAVDAWRDALTVLTEPGGHRVRLRASTQGTTLARLEAVRLGGAVSITRGHGGNRLRVANRSELALERVHVLYDGAVYRIGALPPGRRVEFDLRQTSQRFNRWRLRTLDPREALLVRAAVHGRQLDRELVVVGWTRGSEPSAAPGAAWITQEPTLVLVRAVVP
ncbi:MAG: hypothetical protein R3F62_31950 [Planctomycetota bacterium]